MVGDVTVKNHPVYGSASLSVRSGKVYRNIDSVGSPGAVVGARSVPTTRDVRSDRMQLVFCFVWRLTWVFWW